MKSRATCLVCEEPISFAGYWPVMPFICCESQARNVRKISHRRKAIQHKSR